jgi:dimethylargininase
MKYTHAIVRPPGHLFVNGLSTANLGKPDYERALKQHAAYVQALENCGLTVRSLPPDEIFPDSTFVEDTALLTSACAIILRPGAQSRRGEIEAVEHVVKKIYFDVEHIQAPGTVDGGDIMMAEDHFFIGLSRRTNREGAEQVLAILANFGLTGSLVSLDNILHLKSAIAYVENHTVVVTGELSTRPELNAYRMIRVDSDEQYAANCLWINGTVLIAAGYPKTKSAIMAAGYQVIALDMSEFRKLDGGLSCLSLRFRIS